MHYEYMFGFGKECGMHIEYIMLCDPRNNEVEVQVEIKKNSILQEWVVWLEGFLQH